MEETVKMGRFKRSWILTRAAWEGFKLDKELAALPVIGAAVHTVVFAVVIAIGFLTAQTGIFFDLDTLTNVDSESYGFTPLGYAMLVLVGLSLAAVSSFISGAVIHGALERFKGNDPTIKSSMQAAWKRIGSLTAFAVFSAIIGYIISAIAERIPFIGGMVLHWLASAAWGVASFFAIPVIVSSNEPVNPVKATKGSINLIKKVWGESLAANIGIALIATLTVIVYATVSTALIAVLSMAGLPAAGIIALGVLAFIGILAIMVVFSVLSAFVKAAIYHYATTGESPVTFNKQMLRQAFTPKKARKVFSA